MLNELNDLDDGEIQVRASAFGFDNTDPFDPNAFDSPADPNGVEDDVGINLVYDLPDLAAGESVMITFITSINAPTDGNDYIVLRADETTMDAGTGDDVIYAAREGTTETLIRHSPYTIQIRGNRTTFPPPRNCIPYAAIRWHDFGNRPALGRPLGHFSRHPDTPLLSLSPRRRFPRPTPERVFVADHQSSSGFSGTGPSAPPPQPIGT